MYLPDLPRALDVRSIIYLDKSRFTLDSSGVAGFFGGAEAISAMATVHYCRNRKTWGWYNSPGSYEVAKRYGSLTKFGFGGGHADPEELLALFGLNGPKGPMFLRVHSGNVIHETSNLADALIKECNFAGCLITPGKGVGVTIAELQSFPENNMELRPMPTSADSPVFSAIPIIVSAVTCVMCAVAADWYSFSLILLGIIANGVSCIFFGSVKLKFVRPRRLGELEEPSSYTSKPRHISGIFITPTYIVLLKAREDAAMAFALGKFVPPPCSVKYFYRSIGACSILLLIQFLAQLLLIPQGSLFGQIMFITSLGVSWCYNLFLCTIDKSGIQQQIFLKTILKLTENDVNRYPLESWPAMVAFVLLTLVVEDDKVSERELHVVFDVLVEETSDVWTIWKRVFLEQLLKLEISGAPASVTAEDLGRVRDLQVSEEDTKELSKGDKLRLDALLKEAQSGIDMYKTRFS